MGLIVRPVPGHVRKCRLTWANAVSSSGPMSACDGPDSSRSLANREHAACSQHCSHPTWAGSAIAAASIYVLRLGRVEIHRSARRHGVSDDAILHATDHPLVVVDLEPDADPPKQLAIGPDLAGNLLEVIVLVLADEQLLAIHAMPLRPTFHDLLPPGGDAGD
jgi:hypothetical protein